MVGDDKRTVRKIEFQPIGGLQFVRQSNCDLKPAHWDDEFVSQFFGSIAPTSTLGPNFVTLPVTLSVKVPAIYQRMIGTKFAFGMVSLRNLHEAADIILGARRKGNVDFSIIAHERTSDLKAKLKEECRTAWRSKRQNGNSWHPPNRWTFRICRDGSFKIAKCRLINARRPRYLAWSAGYGYTNQRPNMNNVAGQLHLMVFASRG